MGLIVGKRGSGKSYTLGVLAESLASISGVTPVVVDPMGGFGGLIDGLAGRDDAIDRPRVIGADLRHETDPRVCSDAIPARAWPELFDIDATSAVGSLLWRVAQDRSTLDGMIAEATDESSDARPATRRAVVNHLRLARSWDVFDPDGISPSALLSADAAVIDLAGLPEAPGNVVLRAVAAGLYEACLGSSPDSLPWLLVDEAHVAADGIAEPALSRLATRGRTPGVSLVAATQRPGALPGTVVSQSDFLVAHQLTASTDVDALSAAAPASLTGELRDALPRTSGVALVIDDATETAHTVSIRSRHTPHNGESPRASEVSDSDAGQTSVTDASPGDTAPTATGGSRAYTDR